MTEDSKNSNNIKLCECGCGRTRTIRDKLNRPRRFIHGHTKSNWKGGILKPNTQGYIRIRHNNSYVLYHRWIFEQHYKCCILPYAEIDHINCIRTDNRIENLRLMTKANHTRRHKKHAK